ncbi:MAG: prepilin-type N-terminal cleavage/methylation domain-containing protein [Desulfuromonadales bacterium]|nr:prepilin-type N-terminal cleavage/methylation domain-containing protein [Desulfuromonadales bacterium]
MRTLKSGQAGFSLAELMIAILILAIGLLGLAELQITAMKSNSKSGAVTNAVLLAQCVAEDIMAISSEDDPAYATFEEVLTVPTNGNFVAWPDDPLRGDNSPVGDQFGDGSRFDITYANELFLTNADGCYSRVTVRVASQSTAGYGVSTVEQDFLKSIKRISYGGLTPCD